MEKLFIPACGGVGTVFLGTSLVTPVVYVILYVSHSVPHQLFYSMWVLVGKRPAELAQRVECRVLGTNTDPLLPTLVVCSVLVVY